MGLYPWKIEHYACCPNHGSFLAAPQNSILLEILIDPALHSLSPMGDIEGIWAEQYPCDGEELLLYV